MMSNPYGKFVWYELMTTDATAAESFYRKVIGWGAKDAGMPDMTYMLMTVGEAAVAGMMTMPAAACAAGMKPGWMGYVGVEDVDASAAKLQQGGGVVHKGPADIPGVGRFAIVGDPQGAVFALFKWTMQPQGAMPAPPTPGTAGWRELYAGEWKAAFGFYSDLFGWAKGEAIDMGPMGTYQILNHDGEMFGGMMTKPETVPMPVWQYYFCIEDIDAAMARVQAGGGQIVHGPQQVPGGSWIAQCIDPQGAHFAMVGPKG